MLGRWLKKKDKLDDPDPIQRLAAIEALAAPGEAQDQLVKLAQKDPDDAVRAAAIAKLEHPSTLESLLADTVVTTAVANRMAQLIRPSSSWSWLAHEPVFAAFLRIMDAADTEQVLAQVTTTKQLVELLISLPHNQVDAHLSHALLADESSLQLLERSARGRNKKLYRFAHDRLETNKRQRAAFEALKTRCSELDESLTKPSEDLIKIRKLLTLRKELVQEAALLQAEATLPSDTFALPSCPITDEEVEQRAQQAEQRAQEEKAKEEALREANKAAQLADQQEAEHNTSSQSSTAAHDRLASAFWSGFKTLETNTEETPLSAQLSRLEKRLKTLNRELAKLAWPEDEAQPEVLSKALAEQAKIPSAIDGLKAKIADAEKALNTQLQEIDKAFESGETKSLGGNMKQARALLKQLPSSSKAARQAEKEVARFSAKLAELRDWQKFATDPKRQELLTELEALSQNPLPAPEQANELKRLREQWQQMGRPTSAAERQQQEQFDQFAEVAFEPCKAYYEELAEERRKNLEARIALATQLDDYIAQTDWANADFKAAEQIMRTARDEWRKFHPCERRALKPVEEKFEALQTDLHSRLKAHWDANIAAKRSIIERTQSLLEETDGAEQVRLVKQEQSNWKNVGATPRAMDQRLWREFRSACDAIFEQRTELRSAENERQAKLEKSLGLAIEQLEKAAERANRELDASAKEFDTLNAQIEEVTENLTRNGANKRLSDARKSYRGALNKVANAATITEIKELEAWDVAATEKELAGEELADRSNQGDVYSECLALALESELAADLPSPSADQAARMALQIEFMNNGIRDLSNRDHRELITRWNQLGPKTAEVAPLRERFFAAIAHRFN